MQYITSFLFSIILVAQTAFAQTPVNAEHDAAKLRSEVSSVAPGDMLWLSLSNMSDEGSHTLWKNPGNNEPSQSVFEWRVDDGVSISQAYYPVPTLISAATGSRYGYPNQNTLLFSVSVPEDFTEKTLDIKLFAEWLTCQQACSKQQETFDLSIPVGETVYNDDVEAHFIEARQALPQDSFWSADMQADNDEMQLLVHMSPQEMSTIRGVTFIPSANGILELGSEQSFSVGKQGLLLRAEREAMAPMATELNGILSITDIEGKTVHFWQEANPSTTLKTTNEPAQVDMSLIELIIYALLGGLILNLMPCVFPVLSLKALALLRSHENHRMEGWSYTAGILVSFSAIAVVLLLLRAGGETIGWGFQLQEPRFVALMVFVLVAVGLSLSGLFSINLGIEGAGQSLTESKGSKGSFFTGVLATLVATPCTAPFMAPALAFAITQPVHITFLGFLALGFGLALPFLLLSYVPTLSKILPKPGAWMEKLKEALAFPMYITAAWLIWVFTNQTGSDAALMLMLGLILFSFAIWMWQQSSSRVLHMLSVGVIAVSAFIAVPSVSGTSDQDILDGEPYTTERLEELRADDRRVFVYFSADWCITCKVNERISLYSDTNRTLAADRNIAILKGDWTNRNEMIAKVLASHNRMGVPLYLYYPRGADTPIVLPEILTPNSITDIFKDQ